jgi:hypothetical protein
MRWTRAWTSILAGRGQGRTGSAPVDSHDRSATSLRRGVPFDEPECSKTTDARQKSEAAFHPKGRPIKCTGPLYFALGLPLIVKRSPLSWTKTGSFPRSLVSLQCELKSVW